VCDLGAGDPPRATSSQFNYGQHVCQNVNLSVCAAGMLPGHLVHEREVHAVGQDPADSGKGDAATAHHSGSPSSVRVRETEEIH